MARSQTTTRNMSIAYKLANNYKPSDVYATNIAYDKKSGSWQCWFTDADCNQIGFVGQGSDPMAAAEHMLELNRVDIGTLEGDALGRTTI